MTFDKNTYKITDDLKNWPVVLITGARQVGKTTICNILEKELDYNYISLDNTKNRFDALNDPDGFLETHPWTLIILGAICAWLI